MSLPPFDNSAPAEKTADAWLTAGRFAVVLGILITASFPQVVAGLEAFVRLDSGRFAYPVAFHFREAFWRGEIPLWNPLNSCGIPFLAQWNTLTLYPLSLFYLLLPLPWSFGVFCLGHLVLAGVGMHCLARRWTGSSLGAAVAGAAFAFNGLTWQGLMWPHLLAALGWMPWVILVVEQAWREGGRWLILAALAGALQLLSGGAEAVLFTWLVLGVMWLAMLVRREVAWPRMVTRTLVIGCLATGLAAVQMAPFLDLLAHSQRNVGYGDSGGIVMPIWGWANYLVPLFHSFRTSQGIFIQPTQNWIASYYVGAGVVGLALLAIWRVRTHRTWLLLALTLFGLTMALGSRGYVYDGVRRLVPVLGFIRFPVKWVMLVSFAIPLLAAYGLSWLQSSPDATRFRERNGPTPPGRDASSKRPPSGAAEHLGEASLTGVARTSLIGLASGLLGVICVILFLTWKFPLPSDNVTATIGNGATRMVFVVLVFGCVALCARVRDPRPQRVLQLALILLLWLDVFTHAPNLNPTAPCSTLEPDMIRRFFNWDNRLEAGASRALQSRGSHWKMVTRLAGDQETDIYGRRLSLFADLNLLDHVSKFDGFYSLDLKQASGIFNLVYFGTNDTARLQDFLGISLTGNPTNAVEWVSRSSFLPLVTTGQRPVFADDPTTFAALGDTGFDPLHIVYLPLEARGRLQATNAASARVVSSLFSAHRLAVEVETEAPAMVVVSQAYYHPWHAYVDGRRTPLWRANYAFQALEVPPGKHQVSLVYEDRSFTYGGIVSLASLLGCGAVWIRGAGRRTASAR